MYKEQMKKIGAVAAILLLILVPSYNLFVDGILSWHIKQPEFYVSGGMCMVFIIVLIFVNIFHTEKTFSILLLLGGVFLSWQGVIIPYIVVWGYFEIICYLGFFVRNIRKENEENNIVLDFLAGISMWGASAIVFSLLGLGTINKLRIMTIALFAVALMCNKAEYRPIILKIKMYLQRYDKQKATVIASSLLIFLSFVLAARTNVGTDIDSLWYMLKPEYMLVGENSFYDYLGYAAYVHYYPKLVELFFLPISGLGDYSFILIGNVLALGMLAFALYYGMDHICKNRGETFKLLVVLLIVTVPAISVISITAKGDVLGCFFTVTAFYLLIRYLDERDVNLLGYLFLSLALSTGTKLTYLLWGGILFVFCVAVCIHEIIKRRSVIVKRISSNTIVILLGGFFFWFGVHLRTLLLTGYPTYPTGSSLWKRLGFVAKYTMKEQEDGLSPNVINGIEDILNRAYVFFFDPESLSHTVMCWPTNLLLIAIVGIIISIVKLKRNLGKKEILLLGISAAEGLAFLYFAITMYQPDGNYFIAPLTIIILICVDLYNKFLDNEKRSLWKMCYFLIPLYTMLNVTLLFVVNWGWGIGLKYTDRKLIKDNFETKQVNEEIYLNHGYAEIAECIENIGNERVMVSGNEDRIDGAVETAWSAMSTRWISEDIVNSYENFAKYVKYADIKCFILLDSDESIYREYVEQLVKDYGYEIYIQDTGAVFYKINLE